MGRCTWYSDIFVQALGVVNMLMPLQLSFHVEEVVNIIVKVVSFSS